MITESNYLELMKNCSKWNSRVQTEKKNRCRVPYFDHQTATAHRQIHNYYKTKDQRCHSNDPNVVIQYPATRWIRKDTQPLDALEVKMFLRDNPALDAAVNQSSQLNGSSASQDIFMAEIQNDSPVMSKGTPKPSVFEEFADELDDDVSVASGSDEDDWGSKRKKGKATSTRKKKASAAGRPREPHACSRCGAKYKSLAGLTYHNAYVHHELNNSIKSIKLLSPSVEVNDYCDYCLGDRFKNKNTNKAEDLVVCHDCGRAGHPSCLTFNENVTVVIGKYGWQCIECKSCTICGTSENDDQLLFCDDCDRGFHLYCLRPPLKKAPENEYSCALCQKEFGANASAPSKR